MRIFYLLFFGLPSHLGHHWTLSRVPCAPQYVLLSFLSYTEYQRCRYVRPNLQSILHTPSPSVFICLVYVQYWLVWWGKYKGRNREGRSGVRAARHGAVLLKIMMFELRFKWWKQCQKDLAGKCFKQTEQENTVIWRWARGAYYFCKKRSFNRTWLLKSLFHSGMYSCIYYLFTKICIENLLSLIHYSRHSSLALWCLHSVGDTESK